MSSACRQLVRKAGYQSIGRVIDSKGVVGLSVVIILIEKSPIAWTGSRDIEVGNVVRYGLAESVADQETQTAGPALLNLHLEAVVVQVPDAVFELDLAEIGKRKCGRQAFRIENP